jgi:predicted KAP-like P-loop ATPase
MPHLNIPTQTRDASAESRWRPSTTDDPIEDWNQDIIGRTSVVELLAEHIFVHRTPIVALHGGLGDGKSSVLKLLRRSLGNRAIVVSFSTWLPGSDETLAVDLFRDIANECRRILYVPQLKKRTLAYARTISGSVSYLAGLKEMLPTQSQQQEIEELRDTLARVPVPIVVLLDEVDRMQRDELLVLLKILRGASSIPNVTFICAFSEHEITKQLAPTSYEYLEKFFPVSVNLSPPDPVMIERLFQDRIRKAARDGNWFLGTDEKTFVELLQRMWQGSLSRICTNLRKTGLLMNDLTASARIIGAEVNSLDLIGIETVRRFAPPTYDLVRKNPAFLTYGSDSWTKGRHVSDKVREKEAPRVLAQFEDRLAQSGEPSAFREILSLLFPQFVAAAKEGLSIHSMVRPTDETLAEKEKRICDSDYFPIYFRAAVPEEMFSEAELSAIIVRLNQASTEGTCERVFKEVLDAIPANHPKRADFLWKLGRAVNTRLNPTSPNGLRTPSLVVRQITRMM